MIENFFKLSDQLVLFSEKEKAIIATKFKYKKLKKNTIQVDLGDIAKEYYFILKGTMRFYYLTEDGKEITGYIFQESNFAGSLESYFSQIPSTQVLESIEACEVLTMSYQSLQELYEEVPRFNILVRKILERRLINAQSVVASLIINKPEDRYYQIINERPDLINRIPQHVLATFLGITPVSLSRIRSRKPK